MIKPPIQKTHSPKQVARSPYLFGKHLLKIQDKEMRTIRLVHNPVQTHYLMNRSPRDIILKPRQKGITTLIQAEFFRYTTTRPASTITLGKDDENTKEIRRIWKFFYDNLPDGFAPAKTYDNATLTTFPGMGSRAVIGTAGSINVGRGGTRTHFAGSEVAFWIEAQSIINGAMQAGNLQWVALESTANGASGWFYDRVMECIDDKTAKSIWKLHFYQWFYDDEYSIALVPGESLEYTDKDGEAALAERWSLSPAQVKWRRAKISEIGSLADFLQEYPEDVLTCFKKSGEGYFGDVDHCFRANLHPVYDASHTYVAGLDFGQQQDFTVLIILDATTFEMVAMYRMNKTSWKQMRNDALKLCQQWHVEVLHAEVNSVGSVNIEEMRSEAYNMQLHSSIVAFDMNAATKPPLMAGYRAALHEGGLYLQDIEIVKYELNAAVTKQTQKGWTVESPRDDKGHGDSVVAGALAVRSAGFVGMKAVTR